MSLRQLKFKPKFQPPASKDKKNEEAIEIPSTKSAESSTPLRTPEDFSVSQLLRPSIVIENCSNKVLLPLSGGKSDKNIIGQDLHEVHYFNVATAEQLYKDLTSTKNALYKSNLKKESNINSIVLPLEVILEVSSDSNLSSPKCVSNKEDNGATDFSNYTLSCKKSCKKIISEEVQSSEKEKPVLPSLRQLKCKPKINSLKHRSLSKETIHPHNNKKNSENNKAVPCSSPTSQNDIAGIGSLEIGTSVSFPKSVTNTYENTEVNGILKEQDIMDENDSGVVKKPNSGKHVLPIRQLNFKPKINLGNRNNKVCMTERNSKTSLLQKKNANGDKSCDDVQSPKLKKNLGRSTLSPMKNKKKSVLESTIKNIIKEHNFNLIKKAKKSEMKFSKEGDTNLKKSLNSTISTFSESISKKDECYLKGSNSQPKIKQKSKIDDICESLQKKKYNSELSINCSKDTLKKKDSNKIKSGAVYGSKSIRSCHLGVPFKPKLTNRSKRPFATSTFGKMCFEARTQFEKKFGDKTPDASKLTMLDLIFYNPSTNPMPQSEDEPDDGDVDTTIILKGDLEINNAEPESCDDGNKTNDNNDNNDIPVPQLKLSSDGKVVVAQESLVVKQSLGEISENVENITFEQLKYRKAKSDKYRTGWTHTETVKFYKALNTFGSDFETMKILFPNRTRSNLKSKFKREEKLHGKLIDKMMTTPSEIVFKKAKDELDCERVYDQTISSLGKNLKIKRNVKKDHHLLLNTRKKPFSAKELREILKGADTAKEEETIPEGNDIPAKIDNPGRQQTDNPPPNKTNIVISTNIEYDQLKFTQYVTYNSNNLDNPIEVNATISHESDVPS